MPDKRYRVTVVLADGITLDEMVAIENVEVFMEVIQNAMDERRPVRVGNTLFAPDTIVRVTYQLA